MSYYLGVIWDTLVCPQIRQSAPILALIKPTRLCGTQNAPKKFWTRPTIFTTPYCAEVPMADLARFACRKKFHIVNRRIKNCCFVQFGYHRVQLVWNWLKSEHFVVFRDMLLLLVALCNSGWSCAIQGVHVQFRVFMCISGCSCAFQGVICNSGCHLQFRVACAIQGGHVQFRVACAIQGGPMQFRVSYAIQGGHVQFRVIICNSGSHMQFRVACAIQGDHMQFRVIMCNSGWHVQFRVVCAIQGGMCNSGWSYADTI